MVHTEILKIKQFPNYRICNLVSKSDFIELTKIFTLFDIPNFLNGFKKHHLCLLAKADDGEILGGVVFTIKEHHAFVISIAVKEQFQRKRIGTAMMKVVEEIVISNVNRIEVIAPKDERKRFYLFLGYKPYKDKYMDKWLSFFKRFFYYAKKTLNYKVAPNGVPFHAN